MRDQLRRELDGRHRRQAQQRASARPCRAARAPRRRAPACGGRARHPERRDAVEVAAARGVDELVALGALDDERLVVGPRCIWVNGCQRCAAVRARSSRAVVRSSSGIELAPSAARAPSSARSTCSSVCAAREREAQPAGARGHGGRADRPSPASPRSRSRARRRQRALGLAEHHREDGAARLGGGGPSAAQPRGEAADVPPQPLAQRRRRARTQLDAPPRAAAQTAAGSAVEKTSERARLKQQLRAPAREHGDVRAEAARAPCPACPSRTSTRPSSPSASHSPAPRRARARPSRGPRPPSAPRRAARHSSRAARAAAPRSPSMENTASVHDEPRRRGCCAQQRAPAPRRRACG